MKIHRFIGKFDLSQDTVALDDPALLHQLGRVLRLQMGQSIRLCDASGQEAVIQVTEITKTTIRGDVRERLDSLPEQRNRVTLYVAILKRENMEWVVQKATEVGIVGVVPIITHRTIKQDVRLDRLREIAHEAAEQCGRRVVPDVAEPVLFSMALATSSAGGRTLFFHTGDVIPPSGSKHARVSEGPAGVFIGPEGGWDEEEVSRAIGAGCEVQTLGSFVLRGETAAVIGAYLAVQGLA